MPEVKRAQVGILTEFFQVLARGSDTSESNRDLVELLAEAPEVAEAVDKMLKNLPKTKSRGSFADMLKQRDETGLLRRQP
jgi:gamma-glutamyl phosphate reductase